MSVHAVMSKRTRVGQARRGEAGGVRALRGLSHRISCSHPRASALGRFALASVLVAALVSVGSVPVAAQADGDAPDEEALDLAREAFREGNFDYIEGRYADAIRHFQDAHSLVPNPRLVEYMGRCHANLGNYPAAIEAYEAFSATSDGAAAEVIDVLAGLRGDARLRAAFEAAAGVSEAVARARGEQPPPRDIRRQELGTLMQDVTVIVRSQPRGADVYLDAIELGVVGTTPLETPLFVGQHLIEVRHPLYEPVTRIVTVAPPRRGESVPVFEFTLERRPVPVEVRVEPSLARVSWVGDDGTPRPLGTGQWSGELPAGPGAFVVQHAGDSRTFDATLEPTDDGTSMPFVLTMVDEAHVPDIALGVLVLVVDDPGADVLVNGRMMGTSPGEFTVDLTTGLHRVEVRRDGYTSWERDIEVAPDAETRLFPAPLERARGRRRGR